MTDARDIIRRTTIELGPLRITREYRCAPPGPHYPFYEPARVRSGGGWRAAGVLGVVLAVSAGGLSMAATHAPPVRTRAYAVSVPVPQQVIAPPPVVVAQAVRPVVPVAKATPSAKPAVGDDLPQDSGSRATAIAAALRSGEVQEWYESAGQVHGFVVAGETEAEGGRTCRALSVLTRAPGGADRVDQRRECLPAG
ncbi:hypothetical protein F4693_002176 [Sphingomonas endophytica]|uniref:Uncharacterized protein n=1 Tax=Sphingomonas endophytica TaxID=869719 RepID=A0A7X0MNC2_9SPHN|nr:hypothetical protein [Sphingomonas endophytica]MBB6505189.1 hypothetical protein [Sphingomonas endophytica]